MESNLRPLALGEILDRTAQLYRTHFWLFAGISAVYSGALLGMSLVQIGVQEFFRAEHLTRYLIWVGGIGIMIQFLIMFLFGGLAVAANNRAVAWVHLGQSATIRGAYGSILPRAGRYLWLMTMIAVILWTPLALAYGGYLSMIFVWLRPLTRGGVAHMPTNPPATAGDQQATLMLGLATVAFGLVFVLAVAYAVVMGLRYALSIAASVVEDLKARQAMRRSIELSKGSRGRIFVLALLVMVIQIGLVAMTQVTFVVLSFRHNGELSVEARVLQQLVAFVTNTFIGPLYATGLTLFYYDQRIRKEGYDIEWMMEAAGLTAPAAGLTAPAGDVQVDRALPPGLDGLRSGGDLFSEGLPRPDSAEISQNVVTDHPEHA